MLTWPPKDPEEVLDYQVDWSPRLVTGETLATSLFTVASGTITISSQSNTTTVTTVWLAAGTPNTVVQILNKVTTSGGRTYEQTVRLRLREK